jgi:hypothetical protein
MRSALVPLICLAATASAVAADPPTFAPWPGGRPPERIHKCERGRALDQGPEAVRLRDRLKRDAQAGRPDPDQARRIRGELRALDRDEARACAKGFLTETQLDDFAGRLQRLAGDVARSDGGGPDR